jgi:hypothetical protein
MSSSNRFPSPQPGEIMAKRKSATSKASRRAKPPRGRKRNFEFNAPGSNDVLGRSFTACGVFSELAGQNPPSITVTITLTTATGRRSFPAKSVVTTPNEPTFEAYFENVDPGNEGELTATCTDPPAAAIPVSPLVVEDPVAAGDADIEEPDNGDEFETIDQVRAAKRAATPPAVFGSCGVDRQVFAYVTKKGKRVLNVDVDVPHGGAGGIGHSIQRNLHALFPAGRVEKGKYGLFIVVKRPDGKIRKLSQGHFKLRRDFP